MNNIMLSVLVAMIGMIVIEGMDIYFKNHEIRTLKTQTAIYKDSINVQNDAIEKIHQESEDQINLALKARSDALVLKNQSDAQLAKLQAQAKKQIGTTCDSAMKYGAKKGQSLYRCYQLDCTSKS